MRLLKVFGEICKQVNKQFIVVSQFHSKTLLSKQLNTKKDAKRKTLHPSVLCFSSDKFLFYLLSSQRKHQQHISLYGKRGFLNHKILTVIVEYNR